MPMREGLLLPVLFTCDLLPVTGERKQNPIMSHPRPRANININIEIEV